MASEKFRIVCDVLFSYREWKVRVVTTRYVDIKMALRNFNCPSEAQRNIIQIDKKVCLYFFNDARGNVKNSISGRVIRNEMHKNRSPDTLPALREWSTLISRIK